MTVVQECPKFPQGVVVFVPSSASALNETSQHFYLELIKRISFSLFPVFHGWVISNTYEHLPGVTHSYAHLFMLYLFQGKLTWGQLVFFFNCGCIHYEMYPFELNTFQLEIFSLCT